MMVTSVLYFINEDKMYETRVAQGGGGNYVEKFNPKTCRRATHEI